MAGLSDAVVIGTVLTLIFGAVAYYLYTRILQQESKVNFLESILLNLKMATEAYLLSGRREGPPSVAPPPPPSVAPEPVIPETQVYEQVLEQAHEQVHEQENEPTREVQVATPSPKANAPPQLHVVRDTEGNSRVHIGFESMSWKELCVEAAKRNIRGTSRLNRPKLIAILNRYENASSTETPVPSASQSVTNEKPNDAWAQDISGSSDFESIHDLREGAPLS